MTVSQSYHYISTEEYLEGERISPIKHEYIGGEVYAMAGASKAHVTIAGNLVALLRKRVRGRGCMAYMADMNVRIETADIFYSCGASYTRNGTDDDVCLGFC